MPRYVPKRVPELPDGGWAQNIDEEFARQVAGELKLVEGRAQFDANIERHRIAVSDRTPYGPGSPFSWLLDSAAVREVGGDPNATERLNRERSAAEKRAVSTSTLTFISSAVIPPYVAEAVSYGIRSTAPLAAALLRLDLPPSGLNVDWAKVTTPVDSTAGSQSAENAAVSASTDPVVGSVTDALRTISTYIVASFQSFDRAAGWADVVFGEELGRAFGARLEQQVWAGTGGAQLTGFAAMSGNSSSTVSAQTLAGITSKISDQYQQVAVNVGSEPDLIAMAPRRFAQLVKDCAALGLSAENVIPQLPRESIVVSPAAPLNLGTNTNEDWILLLMRSGVPLVRDPEPVIQVQRQQAGTSLQLKMILYAYCTLGVSRRPEAVGLVKGGTAPSF